jgi:hypothetical protein
MEDALEPLFNSLEIAPIVKYIDDTVILYDIKKLYIECKFKINEKSLIAGLGNINIYTSGLPEYNYLFQKLYFGCK